MARTLIFEKKVLGISGQDARNRFLLDHDKIFWIKRL